MELKAKEEAEAAAAAAAAANSTQTAETAQVMKPVDSLEMSETLNTSDIADMLREIESANAPVSREEQLPEKQFNTEEKKVGLPKTDANELKYEPVDEQSKIYATTEKMIMLKELKINQNKRILNKLKTIKRIRILKKLKIHLKMIQRLKTVTRPN